MKRFAIYLLVFIFLIYFSGTAQAFSVPRQPFDEEALDAFILSQMRRHNLPGVAVAVTQGEDIVYLKGFGAAGKNKAMTADTPMYIGSLSKSFTALAVMQLQQEGKLDIDQPVIDYLPDFRTADKAATQQITIRNLLNHASGLSDFSYIPDLKNDVGIMEGVKPLENAELTAPVGSTFQYFNANYAVLGALVENVSGVAYEEYIEQHIYSPLGMETSFTSPDEAKRSGLATGYGNFFGFSIPRTQSFRQYELPGGYLMMSVRDLSKYLRMQANKGTFNGISILDEEWIEEMHTPQKNLDVPYGMGWYAYEDFGVQLIQHGGTNENFHTSGMIFPEKGITIAILVNKNSILHALFSHSILDYGIKGIVIGSPMPNDVIPLRIVGALILLGFLINFALSVRKIFRLKKWHAHFLDKGKMAKIWDIGSHFLIPLTIIVVLPQAIELFLNRGFTWEAGWAQAPDGMLWLWTGIVLDFTLGGAKLIYIRRKQIN